ncbi:hypothetical protein PR001_g479 [Phytophthora rubi]|uniref:Uncharacterized protein n=1 Tax=Phytophthora rubi TaxID=129364 RepID=A0A6A3PIP3_9STRA|nr:hypothetical protein PR001_g479 [Phytophthora rubi]
MVRPMTPGSNAWVHLVVHDALLDGMRVFGSTPQTLSRVLRDRRVPQHELADVKTAYLRHASVATITREHVLSFFGLEDSGARAGSSTSDTGTNDGSTAASAGTTGNAADAAAATTSDAPIVGAGTNRGG